MPYAPIDTSTETGILTISSVVLHGPAWTFYDLTELWEEGEVDGADEQMPGADGFRAFPRHIVATTYQLPGVIDGDADRFGNRNTDLFSGLRANVDYLNLNIVGPSGTATGTRPASLLLPGGVTRTADIHVNRLRLGRGAHGINLRTGNPGYYRTAVLEIVVPRGHFR